MLENPTSTEAHPKPSSSLVTPHGEVWLYNVGEEMNGGKKKGIKIYYITIIVAEAK